jgi:hypothetical protein
LSLDLDYPFQQRTTFFNAYLINKLSTSLHDRTVGVEHHTGFEVYRQICQMIDAVPENAEFHMRNDLTILSRNFGTKVVDLKSLYGFRMLLKKKMIEYKKALGKDFDPKQAMQILWTSLDARSREIAVSEKLDEKEYKDLYEHIDRRYKIHFGHLDYKSTAKDDPMGLAIVGDGGCEAPQVEVGAGWPSEVDHKKGVDLDAMGGKGGKGKGDGKCHICSGDGHFARDCPSVPPINPMSPEYHGCNGRGHLRNECPTAHPELKGKVKVKGGAAAKTEAKVVGAKAKERAIGARAEEKARDTVAKAKEGMEAIGAKVRARACMGLTSWGHGAEKMSGPESEIDGVMMIVDNGITASFAAYSLYMDAP